MPKGGVVVATAVRIDSICVDIVCGASCRNWGCWGEGVVLQLVVYDLKWSIVFCLFCFARILVGKILICCGLRNRESAGIDG